METFIAIALFFAIVGIVAYSIRSTPSNTDTGGSGGEGREPDTATDLK